MREKPYVSKCMSCATCDHVPGCWIVLRRARNRTSRATGSFPNTNFNSTLGMIKAKSQKFKANRLHPPHLTQFFLSQIFRDRIDVCPSLFLKNNTDVSGHSSVIKKDTRKSTPLSHGSRCLLVMGDFVLAEGHMPDAADSAPTDSPPPAPRRARAAGRHAAARAPRTAPNANTQPTEG